MKILFIEDDEYTSELLAATLSAHRYAVDVIADGAAGLDLATRWNYDLILLDVLLPTLDGIEVCRRLRNRGCQTPILMLTTQDSNENVIAGLDAGADDYVAKSCAPSQLLARVRALLRRGNGVSSAPVLTWGALCLDPALARVTYDQQTLNLRPKEYSLLELFLRNPQRLLSRRAIIDHLWSIEETPVEGSVTNLIKDLRQRLRSAGIEADLIETVYGLGYRLKTAPVMDADPSADWFNGRATPSRQSVVPLPNPAAPYLRDRGTREQRVKTVIQQTTERFRASLAERLAVLETVGRSLQSGDFSAQQQQDARTHAHKLAGGLGTFGYGKASEIAQAIEHLLDTQQSQETRFAHQFAHLLDELQQELQGKAYPPNPEAHSPTRAMTRTAEG
jgi:DNA-binding response OmpR family regulator/HPt (histidine-containing phosphotransfer) domain-containing protein